MKAAFNRVLGARLRRAAALCALFVSAQAGAPTGLMAGVSDAGPDATIALILHDIDRDQLDVALARTENLIAAYPNFRLAHLIRGDLLLARSQPLTGFGAAAGARSEELADLRHEAIARLQGYRNRPRANNVPRYLLQLRPDQANAIVVDTKASRLYLYRNENGRPVFVADWYVSQGKAGAGKQREGDNKTPVGVYQVQGKLPADKLPPLYGKRAFPLNYPNEWDRMQGRNGHGIWLHGVPPDTYARPPLASEGCVVLANMDLDQIEPYLQFGVTPVVISAGVEWLSLDDWRAERTALNTALETWRRDWESRDTERYLNHYSTRFRAGRSDFETWAKQKRSVAGAKDWIKVDVRNISMLRTPGEDTVLVNFEQEYRSNNFDTVVQKRQYWVREGGQWKIVYEGNA